MKEYMPRIVDKILQNKLKYKGAVLIEGCKWWFEADFGWLFKYFRKALYISVYVVSIGNLKD